MNMENIENAADSVLIGLGNRIRALRGQRSMTLQDLSNVSQVSVAMLSHIERGRSTPSIKVLDRIRLALNVPFGAFFEDDEAHSAEPESMIVARRGQRPMLRFDATGLMKELLSPVRGTQMEMMMLHLKPEGHSGDEPWRRVGEKCGIVLQGQFELSIGAKNYHLFEGDAFQFDSSIAHSFRNTADGDSKIIWIILSKELA